MSSLVVNKLAWETEGFGFKSGSSGCSYLPIFANKFTSSCWIKSLSFKLGHITWCGFRIVPWTRLWTYHTTNVRSFPSTALPIDIESAILRKNFNQLSIMNYIISEKPNVVVECCWSPWLFCLISSKTFHNLLYKITALARQLQTLLTQSDTFNLSDPDCT